MQTTTLSFTNIHDHGSLFSDLLRARHRTFIEQAQWDLPQADGMEFDQYDTPASRWVAVHEYGRILAGVRLTPTTHRCGIYSYMIRDAQLGLLDSIPSDLMDEEAPVAPHIWESSRVFVCDDVPAKIRMRVQMQLIGQMVASARELGATSVIGIIPANSPRLARRVGLECVPAGPVMNIGGSESVCVNISMATKMH
ncbi:N-acyl-L-homoserine lactone synthetase [Jannaschia pagri]|uniref:acyl-homoserine-lactone synthase n=1 Tax=Jannaschia pagri TaxID=2829797 RepID=A0ABQ4NGN2_9RHOB|nr:MULTISPECIES: acyl-homoserine-lactone synthase [unclassified Jannaschia]GIT90305.1 N-acyl-L-homoserine lactone synthetase [Jannaschia sp. AI_61]GIT93589.1 N-acyl-L-homoserine lactone synthetase [Jannaschia sp. AI_62]